MSEQDLNEQIKKMENKKRKEQAPVVIPDVVISFDSWFHQRKEKIARCHHKEILMADFKARGLKEEATIKEFDKALELYGIKL